MSIASPTIESGQRFLLPDVSWGFYERLLDELGDRPLRVTYDRGDLEMMSPSHRHEITASLLTQFLVILFDELDIAFRSGRSTTLRREDLERGLEPDDCFWIQNVEAIIGKSEIDLSVDPPPDLALEIDITSSSLNRMEIYAAIGVPEVWRYESNTLMVYCLAGDDQYQQVMASPTFPNLRMDRLVDFLKKSRLLDDLRLHRNFREWVKNEVVPKSPDE